MAFKLIKNNHPCWGLTGGIGSGKSTVAHIWQEVQHVHLIDTDAISRSLTAANGAAIPAIRQEFGHEFIDVQTGAMNRAKMREHVFAMQTERKRLEQIIHPLIYQKIQQEVDHSANNGFIAALLDIPLLVESGFWHENLDAIVVVDCQVDTQIRRVQERNHLDLKTIQEILAVQASREQRLSIADAVIYNDGISLHELRQEVIAAAQKLAQSLPPAHKP